MIKSFHNRPIETTGILSWNVPDETLYNVQINFLGFLTSYVKCPEAKLEKFYFSVILCKVSLEAGQNQVR